MGGINRKAGGALKVFKASTLADWLRKQNPSDEQYQVSIFLIFDYYFLQLLIEFNLGCSKTIFVECCGLLCCNICFGRW